MAIRGHPAGPSLHACLSGTCGIEPTAAARGAIILWRGARCPPSGGLTLYLESFLLAQPWAALAAMVAFLLLDRQLTMVGARLYLGGGIEIVELERGYEANPVHADAVARLAPPSPRYLGALAVFTAVMALLWWAAQADPVFSRPFFLFAYGMITIPEVVLLARHAGAIASMRRLAANEGMEGRVRQAHWYGLELVAVWAFAMGGLVLAAAAASWSVLLVGGACGQFMMGLRFLRLSRRERARPAAGMPQQALREGRRSSAAPVAVAPRSAGTGDDYAPAAAANAGGRRLRGTPPR